jgi:Fur family zinc uptake transcriptional regulator
MEQSMGKRGKEIQTAVLAILRTSDCPHSAYDLLESLKDIYPKIAPPTVYRALATLGPSVARYIGLESLNAFMSLAKAKRIIKPQCFQYAEIVALVAENFEPDIFSHLSCRFSESLAFLLNVISSR